MNRSSLPIAAAFLSLLVIAGCPSSEPTPPAAECPPDDSDVSVLRTTGGID